MKVFTFEHQVLYPLSHLCSGVLDRNGGLVLRWHEQDVEEKRRAIAIDFIGLTFLEWILRPTGELSRYLLVCSAWDRIFALGVGIGARRKLQISGYTVLALDWNSNMGGIRNTCGCSFLEMIMYVVLDLRLTKTTKNVFLAVWPWPKTQKCLGVFT